MAPAILLMGPTGAGKSDAALALAARLPVEILSVDSAMVYRGLDIGTAKPDAAVRARVPHRLIDIRDPSERFSVAEFLDEAARAMQDAHRRGRVPLLVGGTMLYFRALQSGLAALPPADAGVRAALAARAAEQGWPALHAELGRIDPAAAARVRPADAQRIQRALEVHALTGRPLSEQRAEDLRGASRPGWLKLVLAPAERGTLTASLERRLDAMLERGFLDEVAALRGRGDLDESLPSIRAVGYRQLWQHLAGGTTLEAARREALAATRQLAKRQYTWLRKEPGAEWLDSTAPELVARLQERVERWNLTHRKQSESLC